MTVEREYINRELSWLEFNQRVLDQAHCNDNPLLERLKFLAITGSNLNEFFMVRVGGLKILSKSGSARLDIAGFTVKQQLEMIRGRVSPHVRRAVGLLIEQPRTGIGKA